MSEELGTKARAIADYKASGGETCLFDASLMNTITSKAFVQKTDAIVHVIIELNCVEETAKYLSSAVLPLSLSLGTKERNATGEGILQVSVFHAGASDLEKLFVAGLILKRAYDRSRPLFKEAVLHAMSGEDRRSKEMYAEYRSAELSFDSVGGVSWRMHPVRVIETVDVVDAPPSSSAAAAAIAASEPSVDSTGPSLKRHRAK